MPISVTRLLNSGPEPLANSAYLDGPPLPAARAAGEVPLRWHAQPANGSAGATPRARPEGGSICMTLEVVIELWCSASDAPVKLPKTAAPVGR